MRSALRVAAILPCFVLPILFGCEHLPAGGTRTAATVPPLSDYRDPEALYTLISTRAEPYYLIDVRSKSEYVSGHIPTAINIPYDVIGRSPPTPDKAALIVVYCGSGVRSAKAAASLAALGYSRVVDFGAISRWRGSVIYSEDPGECPCR
jgi:rhodanese-related sulfurtransferase